jgi:IMP cyclohydrolase
MAERKTPQHHVCSRSFFNRKTQTIVATAVAMIFDESEQEWAERVGTPAATVAATRLIGLFCYFLLILFMPLIFGYHAAAL